MSTLDLDAIRELVARHEAAIGPGGEKAWLDGQLARRVPALLAEVERAHAETQEIAAELAQERTLHQRTLAEVERLRAAIANCAAGYEQIDGGTERVKVYAADVAAKIRAALAAASTGDGTGDTDG